MRRPLRVLLVLPALAASVTIALPLASAQGIPNKQIPAVIAPFPPPKVLAPPAVPGAQYDCPTGYAKPELLLRVQNLKICLPVGKAGLTPSDIAANRPGGTAAAAVAGHHVAPAPLSAGARTSGVAILACGGRTGFYACGRNAMECCPVTQDNPCFSGAYACKADASQAGANMVCCLR